MDESSDAELVGRITGGDPGAFADLYDRYADRIHDLCLHLLHNRHDAADATADVFLAAADHLDQLRDPARLRSWLYAIARNEVYRRTRNRKRETVMDAADFAEVPAVIDLRDDDVDPTAMVGLVREAALGLDERDRLVMEMTLAGGLDGRDLGDALGLGENAAHQAAHRMRERLGRSIGALLVARQGREECDDLAEVLAGWDGTFSVLWRKRVARHVDGCGTCDEHRRGVPAAILGGSAFIAPLPVRFIGPPESVRELVLARLGPSGPIRMGTPRGGAGWRPDGFPLVPGDNDRTRAIATVAAGLLLLIGALVGIIAISGGDDPQLVAVEGATLTAPTSTIVDAGDGSTTSAPDGSTTTSPDASQVTALSATGSTLPGTRPSTTIRPARTSPPTTAGTPASTAPTTAPPTGAPTTTSPPATTTTRPSPPGLGVTIPPLVEPGCGTNQPIVATTSPDVGSVTMTGPTVGTFAFTRTSSTGWTLSWQPGSASAGPYPVTFEATSPTGATRQHETVPVNVCIR